jgi:hypothetical protein
MCFQFATTVLHFHAMRDKPLVVNNASPIQLLVKYALLDQIGTICSYPEFAKRLKTSHKVHPIVRFAAWIRMVCYHMKAPEPQYDPLLRLQMVDQVGFPLIVATSNNTGSLVSCDAFAKKGDYNDLKWLANTVEHGYAIDWNTVAACWQSQFITSPKDFEHLMSVCPDPSACVAAINSKNLSLLIESSTVSLCNRVLNYLVPSQEEHLRPDSAYYTAAWFLFRNQPDAPYTSQVVTNAKVDITKMLIWASHFGFYATNVPNDPRGRTKFLQQELNKATGNLLKEMDKQKDVLLCNKLKDMIVELWSHNFASLSVVGTTNDGMPYEAAFILAESQYPPRLDWHPLLQILSRILHKHGDQTDCDSLVNHEMFYRFKEREKTDPTDDFMLPGKPYQFVEGLLTASGALHKEWQIRLVSLFEDRDQCLFSTFEHVYPHNLHFVAYFTYRNS